MNWKGLVLSLVSPCSKTCDTPLATSRETRQTRQRLVTAGAVRGRQRNDSRVQVVGLLRAELLFPSWPAKRMSVKTCSGQRSLAFKWSTCLGWPSKVLRRAAFAGRRRRWPEDSARAVYAGASAHLLITARFQPLAGPLRSLAWALGISWDHPAIRFWRDHRRRRLSRAPGCLLRWTRLRFYSNII